MKLIYKAKDKKLILKDVSKNNLIYLEKILKANLNIINEDLLSLTYLLQKIKETDTITKEELEKIKNTTNALENEKRITENLLLDIKNIQYQNL